MMVNYKFAGLSTMKTLVRVAFTALSLGGVAHAQSVSHADGTTVGNAHPAPLNQGSDYNYTGGGGG
jgi:hypothetical protein